MIPEIISFSKSMSSRLEEFKNLLWDVEAPCSDIKEVWSSIFNDFVIPKCGWEALWLMSEESCKNYDLIYPTAVIVTVQGYDWDELAAEVSVTGVQHDIVLPSILYVPMIELHPIKDQNYDEYDLKIIGDWLDKCRYFFKYLWYPWDAKMNVKICDWYSSHLENRLQIQCNIQNGVFKKNVTQYYKSLVAESRRINESLIDINGIDLSQNERFNMIKTYFRTEELKTELDLFEDPELRNDLMMLRMGKNWDCKNHEKEANFVWEGGSIDTLLFNLNKVKSHIDSDTSVTVASSLQEAVENNTPGDVIFLPPGSHVVNHFSGLQSGGMIKGLGSANETKIADDICGTRRATLFSCFGDCELESLTVSRQEGTVVQIFEKTLKISNCRLISNQSASTIGLSVLPGSSVIMENCEISGFGVGIVLQKGSKAIISNTRISDCIFGIKIGEEIDLSVSDVEISKCSKSAICVESAGNESDLPKSGPLDLLTDFWDDWKFNFESLNLLNNYSDVVITNNLDGLASDSFKVDVTNETITTSDEENSECSSN